MKRTALIIPGLLAIILCAPSVWARSDARLEAQVEALYAKADQALTAKDIQGYMALFTNDFERIYIGTGREGIRNYLKDLFDGYDALRMEHTLLDITQSGNWIKVMRDNKVEGKSRRQGWSVVSQGTEMDLLMQEGNALKFARATQIDKARMAYVSGRTYRDASASLAFTAPRDWEIFPTAMHPTIQGGVLVLAPDGSSAAMLGYVKLAGVTAQQAAEGDEALAKILSMPDTYKLFKSGPIRFNGREAYEIESEFFLQNDRQRHRRRIYYNANGMLYVVCFDGIPARQWNMVKDGFQSILDSMR